MAIPDEVLVHERRRPASSCGWPTARTCTAHAVVIASGARYRRLAVQKLEAFEASSVHYGRRPSRPSSVTIGDRSSAPATRPVRRPCISPAGRQGEDDRARRRSRRTCPAISSIASKSNANIEVVTRASISRLEGHNGILENGALPASNRRREIRTDAASVPFHRRRAEYRLARRFRHCARSQRFRVDRRGGRPRSPFAGNELPRRLCHRRRSRQFGETGCRRGRRRRPGRCGFAFLSCGARWRSSQGAKSFGARSCHAYRGDRAKPCLLTTGSARIWGAYP